MDIPLRYDYSSLKEGTDWNMNISADIHRETYTASAAPALTILDCENHLCVSSLPPVLLANLEADAFMHRKFGLDVKLRTEPMRPSAKVAARAILCALMIADSVDKVLRVPFSASRLELFSAGNEFTERD